MFFVFEINMTLVVSPKARHNKKKKRCLSEREREGLFTTTIPSPGQKETRGVIAEEVGEVVVGGLSVRQKCLSLRPALSLGTKNSRKLIS